MIFPLVVLASLEDPVPPRLAALEKSGAPPILVARFDGVAPGEYVVAFEPTETITRTPSPTD
jgi:hypothetical protein